MITRVVVRKHNYGIPKRDKGDWNQSITEKGGCILDFEVRITGCWVGSEEENHIEQESATFSGKGSDPKCFSFVGHTVSYN